MPDKIQGITIKCEFGEGKEVRKTKDKEGTDFLYIWYNWPSRYLWDKGCRLFLNEEECKKYNLPWPKDLEEVQALWNKNLIITLDSLEKKIDDEYIKLENDELLMKHVSMHQDNSLSIDLKKKASNEYYIIFESLNSTKIPSYSLMMRVSENIYVQLKKMQQTYVMKVNLEVV